MNPVLEVKNLKKYFKTPRGMLHAVDNISFSVDRGKTLGIVGESGCGKSTLGRVSIGLLNATSGQIIYNGNDITNIGRKQRQQLRKNLQIIFQDPFSSLNPRMSVGQIIAEPLRVFRVYPDRDQLEKRIHELMDIVGLAERFVNSYPHELDGGRRQRIGIARAIALNPDVIICDEPVSALDVSIQAQVLNLLQDLQEAQGLTYLFITHDLSVVKHISDEIIVMYLGCMVEKSSAEDLFRCRLHPYTKGLLSAIPVANIRKKQERILLKGEISSPIEPEPVCRFAARCPYATDKCRSEQPEQEEIFPGHFVACHHVREINRL